MLFRYRPRQTWMPYRAPRPVTQQERYNLQLQGQYDATRRIAPAVPQTVDRDVVTQLEDLAALRSARITVHGVTVAEFRDDRICAVRQYWDELAVLEQLGVLRPAEQEPTP